MIERTTCRISGEQLIELFSLGDLYISDFLSKDETVSENQKVPLTLCLGEKSKLVQLKHTSDFNLMYKKYWYRSGTNLSMTSELKNLVTSILDVKCLEQGDVWIDIGCNDGTLFKFVPEAAIKIGFDPTEDSKNLADKHCNIFINDYFKHSKLSSSCKAKIITSIAMFYDLEDPHEFINDVYSVLDDNGLWIIQMSYLPLMLQQLAFDNICHEHLGYYSLECLNELLNGHGFKIVDFQINPTNGGSCRLYIMKSKGDLTTFGTSPFRDVANFRINSTLNYESTLKLNNPQTYIDFFNKIQILKTKTVDFITNEKKNDKVIWAYGASTKGNTLLQYFGLDKNLIDGIAERQDRKVGLRTVGTDIPIFSESDMRNSSPDYALILPWHFISEFKTREANYLQNGGKFIVPCPYFEVI